MQIWQYCVLKTTNMLYIFRTPSWWWKQRASETCRTYL